MDVAPPLLIDEVVSVSFSACLLESFFGLSFCNLLVGSKLEVASTSKLSLTTLSSWWYSTTTLGTSNTK
ncbi:hypothetical protein CM3_01630 [Mycoplasmoides genitalium M6282]|nr:hypothetical protein CM3_01630 [Mycoplasmoides genitalium M6282]